MGHSPGGGSERPLRAWDAAAQVRGLAFCLRPFDAARQEDGDGRAFLQLAVHIDEAARLMGEAVDLR